MATYADVAARNSYQTAEEARANPVDEVIDNDAPPTESLIDVNPSNEGGHIHMVPNDFEEQKIQTQTQQQRVEDEAEAKKREVQRKAADAKRKAREETERAKRFSKEHPALIGNGIITVIGTVGVGYLGYQKYKAGQLDWKFFAIGAAGIAAFSVVDAFATERLLGRSRK